MSELLQLFAVFTAVAIGWFLGRYDKQLKNVFLSSRERTGQLQATLELILDQQKDSSSSSLIERLGMSGSSLDTHLAVGSFFRSQGEIDKAIEIHQNLYARPDVSKHELTRVQVELAHDYFAAGLLDRAESLLKDVVEKNTSHQDTTIRVDALLLLLRVYEEERDWSQAQNCGQKLVLKSDTSIQNRLAHYCCEQAEVALKGNEFALARRHIKQALTYDRQCARASLLFGRLELDVGDAAASIKSLKRVYVQDWHYISEALPLLRQAYIQQGDAAGFELVLQGFNQAHPMSSTTIALSTLLRELGDPQGAKSVLLDYLKDHASIPVVNALFQHLSTEGDNAAVDLLTPVVRTFMQDQLTYLCENCGFASNEIHWQCPSCKSWESLKLREYQRR